MKTFKDLKFEPKDASEEYVGTKASLDFDNGYGISVITGYGSFTSTDKPYEIAVLKDGELCYDTPITSDVIGHLTAKEVTKIMKRIQKLNPNGIKRAAKIINKKGK
jgi:hypothetical protein